MQSFMKRRLKTHNSPRHFSLSFQSHQISTKAFPSNYISTSKYTVVTFLPKSLLLQFKRYANIYFLIIAILQSISIISPLNPFTALAPFVFVIGLSMLREMCEDLQRHKSDVEINAYKTTLLLAGKANKLEVKWADIEVGTLLLIKQDEQFPADLILLASSLENGVCYIQTSSLDGEKTLKPKNPLKETINLFHINEIDDTDHIKKIEISAQSPDMSLYTFEGSLTVNNEKYFLGPKQLLLRGSQLRNTKWIIGAVVYTGMDTKIMRNAEKSKQKSSEIEKKTNRLIIFLLGFQVTCSTICALMNLAFNTTQLPNMVYINQEYSAITEGFINFWSYFLLFNTMLPISLIVSLEFVKIFQAYFISNDEYMYVKENNRYCKVMTASINEELGQVEYLFTDKTGTLTCNKMEFKVAVIGDEVFGEDKLLSNDGHCLIKKMNKSGNLKNFESIFTFDSPKLNKIMSTSALVVSPENNFTAKIPLNALVHEYWQILATCHECIVQEDEETKVMSYQGQSPDDITLVDAANHMDYKYLGTIQNVIHLEIKNTVKHLELLFLFEFNSDRKRMSIVIRDGSKYKLYIKGADSMIKARLNSNIEQPYLKKIEKKLDEFSKMGLRTLLVAWKEISLQQYETISAKAKSLADVKDRDREMARLAEEIETDLFLLGATAIEDKLQDGVPATIHDFLVARDKLETAENIARSCKLIQQDMTILTFSELTPEGASKKMAENLEIAALCQSQKRKKSLLIEGDTLALVTSSASLKKQFVELTKDCDSVVCCRVNPKQKAQVVRLIKEGLKKITLSIGDGANDVNMIQEADIGIGIYGKEGMRAVQASDFAIGEFQCLWRLLLVHGRWCYRRNSLMIIYFFYKNMIFTIPHFFFSFVCGASGQTIFDDWYISFYNLFFTALPLIMRAVFEQDVDFKLLRSDTNPINCKKQSPKVVLPDQYLKSQIPKLYYIGQKKTLFTPKRFLAWVLWAIFQSLILFGLNIFVFSDVVLHSDGANGDIWSFSITYFTTIILLVDLKLAINTTYWICLHWIAFIPLSVFLYFAYFFVSNHLSSTWVYMTPMMLVRVVHFYLTVLLGLFTFFLLDYLIFVLSNFTSMSLAQSLIEYAKRQRYAYQKISGSPHVNGSQMNNSLMISMKHEDVDEKMHGEIELALQNYITIEKAGYVAKLNDLKKI